MFRPRIVALLVTLSAAVIELEAQQPAAAPRARRSVEVSGVPALNFDADEGFGYGAIIALSDYGAGALPYRYTVQPTVFLTTGGRRDFTAFLDAPALLPRHWRLSAFAGREQQLATPYYGIGNATTYDPLIEAGSTRYYYRYGRDRTRASADLQHTLVIPSMRVLVGAGASRELIDVTPFDSGTTLVAHERNGQGVPGGRINYLRAGLIWDTRDREIGTRSGTWADIIAQRSTNALGATSDFTRVTATVRRYQPIGSRVTFAERIVMQRVDGDAPFYELAAIQTEFKPQDGLGGSSSIRGIPKDRYIGRGLALSNSEVRWQAADFALLGRSSSLVVSTFADVGRVWEKGLDLSTTFKGLHAGYGAGARLAFGSTFVVAADVGHSSQSTAPIYIGLGYLF
jgi:outer membrane protein assembly factor BamA